MHLFLFLADVSVSMPLIKVPNIETVKMMSTLTHNNIHAKNKNKNENKFNNLIM